MARKRGPVFRSFFLLSIILAFCILIAFVYSYTLRYVEATLVPGIARGFGISEISFHIRRLGLSGVDLGAVRVGNAEDPAFSIESVQIDFSPGGLYGKRLDKVALSGIELCGELKNGRLVFSGIDSEKLFAQSRKKESPSPAQGTPRLFLIEHLEINNAVLIYPEVFRLPFELKIDPKNAQWSLFHCDFQAYPRGQKIAAACDMDLEKKKALVAFEANDVHFERFADLFPAIPELTFFGRLDLEGRAEFRFDPVWVPSIDAVISVHSTEAAYENVKFRIPQEVGAPPFHIQLTAKQGKAGQGYWDFGMTNSTDSEKAVNRPIKCKVKAGDSTVVFEMPGLEISGQAGPDGIAATYKVVMPHVEVAAGSTMTRIPAAVLEGNARFGALAAQEEPFAVFSLNASKVSLAADSTTGNIPDISLSGGLWKYKTGGLGVEGTVKFTGAGIRDSKIGAEVKGISATIPFKLPQKDPGPRGIVNIKQVQWKGMDLGSVKASVQQRGMKTTVQGTHNSRLLSGLVLNFSGEACMPPSEGCKSKVRFTLPSYRAPADVDLGRFLPAAKGLSFNGDLELVADLVTDNTGVKGSLDMKLKDGKLVMEEKEMSMEGISVDLSIADLLNMHSAPNQQLRFEKARFGGIEINDGKVYFQIDSGRELLVEKSSFIWCDGNIYAQAFRISPEKTVYDLDLYGDRLKLAMILDQLGVANAQGEGTVNGRIPIRVGDGKLEFGNGFLFSTPGDGGTIRLSQLEQLTAGIPPGSSQYGQLDLAIEALKNFHYQWARVMFMTKGAELELRMQLNGSPAGPLPFVYKKEQGGFVRVEAGGGGAEFEGIRLDVNFRIPIDELLVYNNIIKGIMGIGQ